MNTHNPGKPETPRHLRARIRRRDHDTGQLCGAQGGTHTPSNLRVLCRSCHAYKTTRETQAGKTRKSRHLRLPTEPHPGLT